MAPKKIYFLEGNIGAGKSSFLKTLDKKKYNIIDEPMDKFCKLGDFNPLDLFYKKEISCFHISTYITSLFINILINETVNDKINIICRNVFTTVFCFAKLSNKNGDMTDFEYKILNEFTEIYKNLLKNFDVKIIYLKVNPETCYKRLKIRGRKEESTVEFDYINELDVIYNDFINEKLDYPKIILNGLKSTDDIKEDFNRLI